ncbi:hypothetical protein NBRC10512v2_000106 [Rhodotorula toruloides]|nr:uncharacterized protein RHTO_05012 [Rhodotorula toruloides NP11]EMS24832.1 hypothetical protein RHTO_05012 [Rhodotorula toruloides NP11]
MFVDPSAPPPATRTRGLSSLPTSILLSILQQASYCPGLCDSDPDLLLRFGRVCKDWYNLVLPLACRTLRAPHVPSLVDPFSKLPLHQHVRYVAFNPAMVEDELSEEEEAFLRERYEFEAGRRAEEGEALPGFWAFCEEVYRRWGDKVGKKEREALEKVVKFVEEDRAVMRRWKDLFVRYADSLEQLDVLLIEPVLDDYPIQHITDLYGRLLGARSHDYLQLESLPVFRTLTTLRISVCDGIDLDMFVQHAHLFPALEELALIWAYVVPFLESLEELRIRTYYTSTPTSTPDGLPLALDNIFPGHIRSDVLRVLQVEIAVRCVSPTILLDRFPSLEQLRLRLVDSGTVVPTFPATLRILDIECPYSRLAELRTALSAAQSNRSLQRFRFIALFLPHDLERDTWTLWTGFTQLWSRGLEAQGCQVFGELEDAWDEDDDEEDGDWPALWEALDEALMASDDEMELDEEAARELDSDDEFATGLDYEVEDDGIWTRFWSEEKQQRRRDMRMYRSSVRFRCRIAALPTETLLAIIEAATWCPGRGGPNPDLLAPLGLVCRAWYRLTRPLVYRDFIAALPPRPDILVDPIDGGNLGRFVHSLRFAPYIKGPPKVKIKRLRRRWEFEGDYRDRYSDDDDEFPTFVPFCRMRYEDPGAFRLMQEADDLKSVLGWIDNARSAWSDFVRAAAPTLRRLELADMSEVPIFDMYTHVPRRISSEWAQAALGISTLPPFLALTSLHLTLQNDYHLDEFLEHHRAFPNLEELVALFSGEVSLPAKSNRRSWHTPKYLVPSWPGLARLSFGRPTTYDPDCADEDAVDLERLCQTFEFAAPTLEEWTIDLYDQSTALSAAPHYAIHLFTKDEYPRLQRLTIPDAYKATDHTELNVLFPSLRSLRMRSQVPQDAHGSAFSDLPDSLAYLDLLYPCHSLHRLVSLVDRAPGLRTLYLRLQDDIGDFDPVNNDYDRQTLLNLRRALGKAGIVCQGAFDVLDSDSDADDASFEEASDDTDGSVDELAGEVIDSDEDEKRQIELEVREAEERGRRKERIDQEQE